MKLRIREFREEYGLTQSALAAQLNNVQRNVSNWENGVSEPDCKTIMAIAKLFHISIDELFGVEQPAVTPLPKYDRRLMSLISTMTDKQKSNLATFLDSMLS